MEGPLGAHLLGHLEQTGGYSRGNDVVQAYGFTGPSGCPVGSRQEGGKNRRGWQVTGDLGLDGAGVGQ